MKLRYLILGGVIGTILAVFFLKSYATANYERGLSDGKAKCVSEALVEQANARKDLEKETDKASRITDLDSELRRLGIMRQDSDR